MSIVKNSISCSGVGTTIVTRLYASHSYDFMFTAARSRMTRQWKQKSGLERPEGCERTK